jgi:hypothetical protein
MRTHAFVAFAAPLAALAAVAEAADVRVPQDVRDLKDALIAAQPGDRVVVTGGRHRNGRIATADVTLVGRAGAQFLGDWEISAPGVTIEGCTFRDFAIVATADRMTVRGNRMSQPRYATGIRADGTTGLVVERNRMLNVAVFVMPSTNAAVRGNRMAGGDVELFGDGSVVEDNVCVRGSVLALADGTGGALRRNRGQSMGASAVNGVVVEDNVVALDQLEVSGDGALVEGNRLAGVNGVNVVGDDVVVRDNRGTVGSDGFRVKGDRARVTGNVIVRIRTARDDLGPTLGLTGSGLTVLANDVTYAARSGGMQAAADDSEFGMNVLRAGGSHDALSVQGSRNRLHDDRIVHGADASRSASGVVVTGDGNTISNESVSRPGYDGVKVTGDANVVSDVTVNGAGRCGISVSDGSSSTAIRDCTVGRAGWSALLVGGTGAIVTRGSFTGGGRIDVLDLGTDTQFVGAAFGTQSTNAALRPYR